MDTTSMRMEAHDARVAASKNPAAAETVKPPAAHAGMNPYLISTGTPLGMKGIGPFAVAMITVISLLVATGLVAALGDGVFGIAIIDIVVAFVVWPMFWSM